METAVKVVGTMDLSKFDKKVTPRKMFPNEEIHFFRGKDKKVIGRLHNGKIAIISFDYHGKWVNDGDDWLCDIVKEDDNKAIVFPRYIMKSSDDNFNESVQRLKELHGKGFKKPFLYPQNSRFYAGSK